MERGKSVLKRSCQHKRKKKSSKQAQEESNGGTGDGLKDEKKLTRPAALMKSGK